MPSIHFSPCFAVNMEYSCLKDKSYGINNKMPTPCGILVMRKIGVIFSLLIIDRFEGDWAVIEYGVTTFNFPRSILPPDAKEGDVITISISIDQTVTKDRRLKAEEMMKDFFDS